MPRGSSATQWAEHKDLIERLYIHEGYTQTEVCKYLANHNGFFITERQLEYRLEIWKKKKNLRQDDYIAMKSSLKNFLKRKSEQLEDNIVDVTVNHVHHPMRKIARGISRYPSNKRQTNAQLVGIAPENIPKVVMEISTKDQVFSTKSLSKLLLSSPTIKFAKEIAQILRREGNAKTGEAALALQILPPTHGIALEHLFITSDISQYLLEIPIDYEVETSEKGLITNLDSRVINQAICIGRIKATDSTYHPDEGDKRLNIQLDATFLSRFLSRTIYLVNNNLVLYPDLRAVYQLVEKHGQIRSLFEKILELKSDGAQRFKEVLLQFAIEESEPEVLRFLIQGMNKDEISRVFKKALLYSSPNVFKIVIRYIKDPVQLPDWSYFQQESRYLMDRTQILEWFVAKLQLLLDYQLITIDALRAYKDDFEQDHFEYDKFEYSESYGPWCQLGTRLFIGALEGRHHNIARFLLENCVAFENPATFWETILQSTVRIDLSTIKLWVSKGADLNIRSTFSIYGLAYRSNAMSWEVERGFVDPSRASSVDSGSGGGVPRSRRGENYPNFCLEEEIGLITINKPGNEDDVDFNGGCFLWCDFDCYDNQESFDSRSCRRCTLAPRSRTDINCGVKGCFCLRYPLPLPLFNTAFWGVLQFPGGVTVFDWILEERLPLKDLKDILLLSIGARLFARYSNYKVFQALLKAYRSSLRNTLDCDRLILEAIYYKQIEIVETIIQHRRRDIPLEVYRSMAWSQDERLLKLVPSNILERLDEGDSNWSDISKVAEALKKLDSPLLKAQFFRNFPQEIEELSPDQRFANLEKSLNLEIMGPCVTGRADDNALFCDGYEALLFIIANLFNHKRLGTLESLGILILKKLGSIGFQILIDGFLGYLDVRQPDTCNMKEEIRFLREEVRSLIPTLQSITHFYPDIKPPSRQILRVVELMVHLLVNYGHDSQERQASFELLEELVSLFSDTKQLSKDVSRSIFDCVPELHSMVIEHARQDFDRHEAGTPQRLDTLKHLISVGWDINTRDAAGFSLITYAAYWSWNLKCCDLKSFRLWHRPSNCEHLERYSRADLLELLITLGASVEASATAKDYLDDSVTFLWAPVRLNDYRTTKVLLEHGAAKLLKCFTDADRFDEYFDGIWVFDRMRIVNPLQCAAYLGDERMVLLLLRYGADINATNKYGYTALDQAAGMGRLDTVHILLKMGARKKRLRAAEMADRRGFHSIAKMIREFPIGEHKVEADGKQYPQNRMEIDEADNVCGSDDETSGGYGDGSDDRADFEEYVDGIRILQD